MPEVIRNDKGQPFSKWKPTDKFEYVFKRDYPELFRWFLREYEFDCDRKWRFDYAVKSKQIAVEIDGFGYGHQAQQRLSQNNEKQNAAVMAGWKVLRFDSRLLGSRAGVESAVELTAMALCDMND